MGLMIAWKVREVMRKQILNQKSRLTLKRIHREQVKCVVAQVSQTHRFALFSGIRVVLMPKWIS
ncbi:uncharacterized protein G2W53_014480 [Senna tora]|uniref:Uncharacterized protein n=1 Tax=Senna tora TaxID=362788 RepID=A0A834WTK8_9FABA|nr:uncharacterized protein G2W53_014480 [Senna tora]